MPVKTNIKRNWSQSIQNNLNRGLLSLMTDIDTRSKAIAPRDTGALVNSSRIERLTDGYAITYGSARVPYARKRFYENKKNPQTRRYLAKAADSALRGNISKHFKVGI